MIPELPYFHCSTLPILGNQLSELELPPYFLCCECNRAELSSAKKPL